MKKASKGRQKIEIKKVENDPHRHVTFSKRKNGLFKKATELSTLCGSQLAVILFSQHHKVFSCGRPDVDSVLRRFELHHARRRGGPLLNPTPPHPHLLHHDAINNINNNNVISGNDHGLGISVQEQEYVKSVERLEEAKRLVSELTNFLGHNKKKDGRGVGPVPAAYVAESAAGGGFWWDRWRVEGMEEKEEVQCYKEAVTELKSRVMARIDAMAAGNSAAESGIITDFILNNNHFNHGHLQHGNNEVGGVGGVVDVNPAISISISSPSS
ncbi:unnamed protein product [Linum tenue]|uniref:MADS-box domain-containing protein n=1 Tax=Linum tenue TaxID=586396 RepID=A0AAV0KD84_9ROSI|nr:unnamed protein product [Linum tenue]